jgi:signal transduction histidine kinase
LEISEREKQRIGEDLHDGLGQSLTGLGYLISAVQERLKNESAPEAAELERITRLVEKTKLQIHDMAWGLFTKELRKGGIAAALKELAIETRDVFGISCRFTGPPAIRLANTNVANQVYRIAQEAVNNAAKHSKGKTIDIRLVRRRGRFVLTVRDSGIGTSQTAGKAIGMGQRIMKYRAEMIGAMLKIDATRGKGTTVTCVLPHQTTRI